MTRGQKQLPGRPLHFLVVQKRQRNVQTCCFLTFSLRSRLKQRRRNGLFTLLSHDFQQMFEQIFSVRVKTLSDTDLVASRRLKREKGSLPVDRSTCVAQKRRRSNSPIFPFVPRSRPRSLRESQLVSLSLSFLK